jgi:hypothetical protein
MRAGSEDFVLEYDELLHHAEGEEELLQLRPPGRERGQRLLK